MAQFRERANELKCLLQVEEALNRPDATTEAVCAAVVAAIPPGWQYPDVCVARITFEGQSFATPGFRETEWAQRAAITAAGTPAGEILVCLHQGDARRGHRAIPERGSQTDRDDRRSARPVGHIPEDAGGSTATAARAGRAQRKVAEWQVMLQMLRQTDRNLYASVCRKMLNHLCWTGIEEADQLMRTHTSGLLPEEIVVRETGINHTGRARSASLPSCTTRCSDCRRAPCP